MGRDERCGRLQEEQEKSEVKNRTLENPQVVRIQRVRTPSKTAKDTDTNKRLKQIFQQFLSQGRKIVIDVGDVDPFDVNGIRFGGDTMGDRFKRRAIEDIFLALAQKSGEFELLNVVVDPVEEVREKLSRSSPHELRELMKLYGLDKPK